METGKCDRRAFTAASAGIIFGAHRVGAQSGEDRPESYQAAQDDLYSERDWEDERQGEINLSGFTFRDVDNDGRYSIGDLPHFGSYVEMIRPDGEVFVQKANRNGFSNFAASMSNTNAAITMPGEYQFTVVPPPGWHVTTDNTVQVVDVTEQPGSIGGWVMEYLPYPFGIAPDPVIRGNLSALLESWDDTEILATGEDGTSVSIEAREDGSFELPVARGNWEIAGGNRQFHPRHVHVDAHPVVLSGVNDSHTPTERTSATVLGFDDITSGSTLRKISNGYGGLNWSGLNAISNLFSSGGEGYTNCTQSGEYLAYSSSGHPVVISHDEGFDFIGGYFGIAWPAAEGETIQARAYRDGLLIAEDSFSGSSYGSVYFSANYRNITRLELTTAHWWQFVVDDVEVIVPS